MHDDDLRTCLRVLADLSGVPDDDPARIEARAAAQAFLRNDRKALRRTQAAADDHLMAATAMGSPDRPDGHPATPFGALPEEVERRLNLLRRCYVCKTRFGRLDAFYHRMCPACAGENRRRRTARTDLTGRRALVTGGRVKAGFELVLKMVRDGAHVTALTRFPQDARRRFAAVADSGDWHDRLRVDGLDLRDPAAIVRWCDAEDEPLDILVNLAAQTVRHPPEAYAALAAAESQAALPAAPGALAVDSAGLLANPALVNSWTRLVDEVAPVELLETQLINVIAPFLLVSRLRPLLARSRHPRRYVVNVSAVEGQFQRYYKGAEHPHTNMAKAALNMLTRTSADELARHGILMTSVDPGWFSDQIPEPDRERRAAAGFRTPLDVIDAAARVYHPIVRSEQGEPLHGCLLKDYRVAPW